MDYYWPAITIDRIREAVADTTGARFNKLRSLIKGKKLLAARLNIGHGFIDIYAPSWAPKPAAAPAATNAK